MEEGVSDKKMTGVKDGEETGAECLYHTSPEDMEECVSDINYYKNEKNYKYI